MKKGNGGGTMNSQSPRRRKSGTIGMEPHNIKEVHGTANGMIGTKPYSTKKNHGNGTIGMKPHNTNKKDHGNGTIGMEPHNTKGNHGAMSKDHGKGSQGGVLRTLRDPHQGYQRTMRKKVHQEETPCKHHKGTSRILPTRMRTTP